MFACRWWRLVIVGLLLGRRQKDRQTDRQTARWLWKVLGTGEVRGGDDGTEPFGGTAI